MPNPTLILASTSRYRRALLARLGIPFDVVAPAVDEAQQPGESPAAMALRLSTAKAHAVAALHPGAVVIGSDQVLDRHGAAIGKPGGHAAASAQLQRLSGQRVVFHTGVAVVHADAGFSEQLSVPVAVQFRLLGDDEIERYLRREQPYDCAGSAKSEGLGIALLQSVDGSDPTALIGLPLIATCALLRRAGIDPLAG